MKLINIRENDSIAAVAKVMKDEEAVDDINILDIEVDHENGNGTAIDNKTDETPETEE